MAGKYQGRTFADADQYLAKARNKTSRRISSNRYLARVDENSIALVLHATAVVTYHRDGSFTIYGGGWNTVTTKRTIGDHAPVRVFSEQGLWVVGETGERTPARVQKCRSCKGRGKWQEQDYCYGVSYWDKHEGRETCSHGETRRHSIGMSERTCYRCKGEGRTDYGSKALPILVSAGQAYRVDASGTFLHKEDRPFAPVHVPHSKAPAPYKPEPVDPFEKGGEVVDELRRVLPNVKAVVTHPVEKYNRPLDQVIVSLNDRHGWSRERIADWLDTLDLDLRFTA